VPDSVNTFYLGLGSNSDLAISFLSQAQESLQKLGEIGMVSADYLSPAYGYPDQADFVNRVVQLFAAISPFRLLRRIKQVEAELGRSFTFRWGPRLIDIDLLWYHGPVIQSSILNLPHVDLGKRLFFLVPLLEAGDTLSMENREKFQELVSSLQERQTIKKLGYANKSV